MADDSIDLREYVAVLRRRWGIVVVTTLIVVLLAGAFSFTRTPVYTGHAAVLIQPPPDVQGGLRPDQVVSVDTEMRIVKSAPVARLAERTLQFPLTIPKLLERVNVTSSSTDTLVLDIYFNDTSPKQAAAGANAFAKAYIQYKNDQATSQSAQKRTQIQSQLSELQTQLTDVERKIATAPLHSPEMQDLQIQRDTLNSQIGVLTTEMAQSMPVTDLWQLLLNADVPTSPSSPKHVLNLALGLFAGLFIGVVLAFVRDRTDDRIRDRDQLEEAAGAPVLATIPETAGLRRARWLATERQPRSPSAEAYRLLRTSVMALARSREAKVFAVASPMLREGKTTTTANLAAALSHTDADVLVVSADLREPALHEYFGKEARRGLADVLRGRVSLGDAMLRIGRNLRLLTSGDPPARPAELLQSENMSQLIPVLRDRFDYVLIDCPPILGLADTMAIAPFTDGVILVARAEQSKVGAVMRAADELRQVGARVLGTVLNDVEITRGSMYGYGYGYATGDEDEPERTSKNARPQQQRSGDGGGQGSSDDDVSDVRMARPDTAADASRVGTNGSVNGGGQRHGRDARSRNRGRRRVPADAGGAQGGGPRQGGGSYQEGRGSQSGGSEPGGAPQESGGTQGGLPQPPASGVPDTGTDDQSAR